MTQLTCKNQPFVWTEQCQEAFQILKLTLISVHILAYPDFSLPFELQVDASNTAIGMVLAQKNNREVVIVYASHIVVNVTIQPPNEKLLLFLKVYDIFNITCMADNSRLLLTILPFDG